MASQRNPPMLRSLSVFVEFKRLDKKTYFPHENEHENGKTTMNEDVFFQIKKKLVIFQPVMLVFWG